MVQLNVTEHCYLKPCLFKVREKSCVEGQCSELHVYDICANVEIILFN